MNWSVEITRFRSVYDSTPVQVSASWTGLCTALGRFRVLSQKSFVPLWSPALYPEGSRRARSNVEAVSCLALDFDDGTTIDAAAEAWMDWPHVIHTSWSHTEAHHKFRLVVPLETPIPVAGFARVWHWAAARSPQIDPSCKDPSRMYHVPAVRSHDWPRVHRVHDEPSRMLSLDPDRLPMTPSEAEADRRRRLPKPAPPAGAPPLVRRRALSDRLKIDPDARMRAASALNASIAGGSKPRADHIACPQCSRPSVWFYIQPGQFSGAQCVHKNSCGWHGWVDQLLAIHGRAA